MININEQANCLTKLISEFSYLTEFTDLTALTTLSALSKADQKQMQVTWSSLLEQQFPQHYANILQRTQPVDWKYELKNIYLAKINKRINYQLLYHLRKGNVDTIRELINNDIIPWTKLEVIDKLIPHATDQQEILDYIYHNRESFISTVMRNDISRLHWAIHCRQNLATVINLIQNGEDCNYRSYGQNAFEHAVRAGRVDVMNYLINQDQTLLNTLMPADSLLMFAVKKNNAQLVEVLLAHGIRPKAIDSYQFVYRTELDEAIYNGNLQIMEQLQAVGAQHGDGRGKTPLHIAVKGQNLATVRYFITHHPEYLTVQTITNDTPLMLHLKLYNEPGSTEVLFNKANYYEIFLALADTLQFPRDNHLLFYAAASGSVEIINYLLTAGVPFDIRHHENNMSALHYAVQSGQKETAAFLIKLYQERDITWHPDLCTTHENYTPSSYLWMDKTSENIIPILLKHGSNPNVESYHFNKVPLLFAAAQRHNHRIANLLLQSGVDTTATVELRVNFNGTHSICGKYDLLRYALMCKNSYILRKCLGNNLHIDNHDDLIIDYYIENNHEINELFSELCYAMNLLLSNMEHTSATPVTDMINNIFFKNYSFSRQYTALLALMRVILHLETPETLTRHQQVLERHRSIYHKFQQLLDTIEFMGQIQAVISDDEHDEILEQHNPTIYRSNFSMMASSM